jgi:hypothetical protein
MQPRSCSLLVLLVATSTLASAGGFGKLPVSARSVALGGSLLTVQNDPNALFSNPAGIASMSSIGVSTSYAQLYQGISGDNLSFLTGSAGLPLGPIGAVGVGVVAFRSNMWREGTLAGTYAIDFFDVLSAGVTAKLLYWSASAPSGRLAVPEPSALSKSTVSFDAGVQARLTDILPENDVIFGISLQDLLQPSIAMNGSADGRLNATASIGASYVSRALEYVVMVNYLRSGGAHRYAIGAEVVATRGNVIGQEVVLILRGGGSTAARPVIQGDLFGGFGLTVSGLTLDYAYGQATKIEGLGGSHYLSFRYSF